MTEKRRRAYWPRHLIIPSVEQFRHGNWVSHSCEGDEDEEEMRRCLELNHAASRAGDGEEVAKKDIADLRYSCGTQCCLVGWAALAMGEPGCTPELLSNPATARFLNKFIEFAGEDPTDPQRYPMQKQFIIRTACRASDLFEGDGRNYGDGRGDDGIPAWRIRLTPEEAHRLWKKTADHFGYDTKNLVD